MWRNGTPQALGTGSSPTFAGITLADAGALSWTTDTKLTRYAAKQLMISGDGVGATTNAGLRLGYSGTSDYGGIWGSAYVPDVTYGLIMQTSTAAVSLVGVSTLTVGAGLGARMSFPGTAGTGFALTTGTAISAVPVVTVASTRNFNTSATDYLKYSFTLTSTHASDNIFAYYGGAGGVTSLLTLSAAGVLGIGTGGSTTISTGVGSVRMSSANAATNTAWIPLAYAGTTYYVPAYTTNSP